jgi:hypothetical protein
MSVAVLSAVPAASRFRRRAAAFLVAATLVADRRLAAAPEPVEASPPSPIEALFGVAPGSAPAALTAAAARSHVACRASVAVVTGAPPRESVPVVCAGPPAAAPLPLTATYWYEGDELARAFFVAALPLGLDDDLRRFDALHVWLARALGAPTQALILPRGWSGATQLTEGQKTEMLLAGRARLSVGWRRPDASVELWLAGERGAPVLVVGLRRAEEGPRCEAEVVAGALLDLFPPAAADVRARAAARLAACKVKRAAGALGAALAHDDVPLVQAEALRALDRIGAAPSRDELERLSREVSTPAVVITAADEILARRAAAPARAPAAAPPAPAAPAVAAAEPPLLGPPLPPPPAALPPAPAALPPAPIAALAPPVPEPAPEPVRAPSGPVSGTPLAIGASTVAGAALFRNLGMTGGLTGVTPQLLLGSTGAVIGFGTSWGLSRFGLRPTVDQAAWFTNTTAWGTLAGVGIWSATGSDALQLKYGLPVVGELVGMGAGVWSARRWTWTGPQIVVADSLVLGAGLASLGVGLIQDPKPQFTVSDAIVTPVAMVGAAVASRYLDPTERDVGLMMGSAAAGGWTGGLLAAGLSGTDVLGSHQSWGGVAAGLGLGYLGGAAAGAFTEVSPALLGAGGAALVTGNVLGLGLHLTIQGFSHDDVPGATFTSGEVHARATSAAIGGALFTAAGVAAAPHLRLGPSATSMTLSGIAYGAGTWFLASQASYDGRPVTDVGSARLEGGLLTGAALGGVTGLVASGWFAPDAQDQVTAAAGAVLGMGAGLGAAKLATDQKGTPDALGVLLGAGAGLAGGAVAATKLELRAPDLGGGAVGLATGLLAGELLPTIDLARWQDSRATAGGALLGTSLGAVAGMGVAHATRATGAEVGVVATAGGLGLAAGTGLGLALPCAQDAPCTSQAPRVGALAGTLGLMGAALALEPRLHLATTLGPDAPGLALMGGAFGAADGLLFAGALDPSGLVSGASSRALVGGVLFGASVEGGAGLVASKWARLGGDDALVLVGGKVTGGLAGLGASMLLTDKTGRSDTVATLAGSVGGLAAATITETVAPLRPMDGATAATGAAFGAFLGALAPTLDEPRWPGLDHRETGGGLLLGLSAGAIGGAALGHAANASPRGLGLTALGGADGLVSGLGLGLLLDGDTSSRRTRVGLVAGTSAGLALGGLVWPRLDYGPGDVATTAVATSLGAWTGAWLPVLGHASTSDVSLSKVSGGLLAGAGLTAAASSLLAPRLALDDDLLFDAVTVDALFTAAGAGAGALASTRADAPVWGLLGAGTAGLVLGGALHRSIDFDATTAPLIAAGGVEGAWLGGWIPALLDHVTDRQRVGALALGGFGGLGLATVASAAIRPDADLVGDAALVGGLWTAAGAGAGALASTSDKAPVWGLLGAGTAGLVLGGALHRSIELTSADEPLIGLAGGEGAWLGGWIPSLLDNPTARQRAGALALGAFGGVGLATLASPALKLDADTATDAALVGALWTGAGAGAGALASTSDKAPVWGLLGAGTAGLVLGGAMHRSLELTAADEPFLLLAGGEGAWLGGWIPALLDHPTDRQRAGALALGAFGGVGLATVASPALKLDADVAADAAGVSALWAGAGAGAGALASTSDKAPVWGLLGASTAGLALGGALHESIELDAADAPFIGLSTAEGLWLGGWLPYALHTRAEVTDRERAGALALGGFGAAGLATVASGALTLAPATAGYGGLGSALGASMGGGVALLSSSLHDQAGVGLMLGGTAVGLASGLALAPQLRDVAGARVAGGVAAGAGLGASEALLFAWSGRADTSQQYAGAALLGGGLGATLGLAAAATPESERGSAPATAGFAAWGAFSGALAGSLVGYDPHDIVFGGLIGANAGFVAGYALLRTDMVEARDFGWLSLFGALGTVAGAGVAAPFSSGSSVPIRAGMAIGPVVGMVTGALVLPRIRRALGPSGSTSTSAALAAPEGSAASETEPGAGPEVATSAAGRAARAEIEGSPLGRKLAQVGSVTDWQPLVGALPASPDGGPAPVLFGLTGHWK